MRALRPRQWLKNVLVLAAPLASGQLFHARVFWPAIGAVVAFCLVASAVYLVNDARDVEEDRRHPKKRFRPIAAGELRIPVAIAMAVVIAAVSIVGGFLIATKLGVVLVIYLALQVCYSQWFKHQPVLDLAMVSSGFLLRAVAGGAAAGLALSQWFLLVASFGSLFMVSGKRFSEMRSLGAEAGTRKALDRYTESYLRFVWIFSTTITVMAYALWALQMDGPGSHNWHSISIAPLVLALLRYAIHIDAGEAGAPEDIVLGDRVLQVLGLIWIVLFCLGVFGVKSL